MRTVSKSWPWSSFSSLSSSSSSNLKLSIVKFKESVSLFRFVDVAVVLFCSCDEPARSWGLALMMQIDSRKKSHDNLVLNRL